MVRRDARVENRKAAACTELAILLPFLALGFGAVLDFGRIYYTTQALEQAAYVGASYASGTTQSPSTVGRVAAAQNAAIACSTTLPTPLSASDVSVNIDSVANTAAVTVSTDFQLLTSILGLASPIRLTRTVTLSTVPSPGS